jgi:hypothetical protein
MSQPRHLTLQHFLWKNTKQEDFKFRENRSWMKFIQHVLVGGGGADALPALMPSCVGHVHRLPINFLDYCKVLLDYSIWIVIVVHGSLITMLLLKLLYLILSQPSHPPPPPPPPPPVNPFLISEEG